MMKTNIQFEVIGKAQGKGRPRATSRGGFARVYTPDNTANYENWIKTCFLQEISNQKLSIEDYSSYLGPVKVEMIVKNRVPKSYSKKKTKLLLETSAPYLSKPDCDNIAKVVCDALNKIAYSDDSQIYDLSIKKEYSLEDKIIVIFTYLEA